LDDSAFRPLDIVDAGSFLQMDEAAAESDPLGYPSYPEALEKARARSGSDESVRTGSAAIGGHPCALAAFDFGFFGGSMGEVTGERLAQAMERAASRRVPFVLVTSTGGARMQEGMRSLVQMPKVVAARLALADARVPFVAVLGHPTTGGVLAGIAALADVIVAIAGATVGFAGPRLVEHQTGNPLRAASHTAESAFAAGLVDEVTDANEVGEHVARVLSCLAPDSTEPLEANDPGAAAELRTRDAWASVEAVRAPDRPAAPSLASAVLDEAVELRGDRSGGNDPGVRAFLGRIQGRRLCVLALDRAHPPGARGFRKAIRVIDIAGRLGVPVATLIDTPGADASEASEAGGVAWRIAELSAAMLSVPVPVVSILTGEGGSGGALAFACADVLVAYDDSIFAVIGPELAAEILFRDPARAEEAAALLKITARDLLDLGIADRLIPGPPEPDSLRNALAYHLARAQAGDPAARRSRWRSI
jgi:acyl-CoA carboxylase subunit beta